MFLSEKQEKDIQNHICPYCHSGMASNETHPDYYRCPKYCIRVWFESFESKTSSTWVGIRIFCGDSLGLRYYNNFHTMEIYDSIHQIEVDVFDIADLPIHELKRILESYLISKFLIENKKV